MDEDEKVIWAAGYLSSAGTLLLVNGRPTLVVKSSYRAEALTLFAEHTGMGIKVNYGKVNGKPGYRVTLTGKRLHELMQKLWPYLPKERRREYARIRKAAQ